MEELSKIEEQLEEWEKMRNESKSRQREDRRLDPFWHKNKTFPMKFGGDDETPDAEQSLAFWKGVNNEEVIEGL